MKVKDAILSALFGYAVTTLPIWEIKAGIWFVGLAFMVLCWDVIIRIEERYGK